MDDALLKMTLGHRVRSLRKLYGMTQRELADKCGYTAKSSNTTINKIEKGQSDLPVTKLVRLSEIFEVTPEYLLVMDDKSGENVTINRAFSILEKKIPKKDRSAVVEGLRVYFERDRETTSDTP